MSAAVDRLARVVLEWTQEDIHHARLAVRAILAELREPNEEMIAAAYDWTEVDKDLIEYAWQAMIDSLLKE